jgi:hypothetical protein
MVRLDLVFRDKDSMVDLLLPGQHFVAAAVQVLWVLTEQVQHQVVLAL